MTNSAVIKALVDFVKVSYPDIDYDDSGVADPEAFPISVISSMTFTEDDRGALKAAFTIDHWSLASASSADGLQDLCDGIKATISGEIISFSGGYFLPHFDSELSDPEEPDYIHKVQTFSGNIYGG